MWVQYRYKHFSSLPRTPLTCLSSLPTTHPPLPASRHIRRRHASMSHQNAGWMMNRNNNNSPAVVLRVTNLCIGSPLIVTCVHVPIDCDLCKDDKEHSPPQYTPSPVHSLPSTPPAQYTPSPVHPLSSTPPPLSLQWVDNNNTTPCNHIRGQQLQVETSRHIRHHMHANPPQPCCTIVQYHTKLHPRHKHRIQPTCCCDKPQPCVRQGPPPHCPCSSVEGPIGHCACTHGEHKQAVNPGAVHGDELDGGDCADEHPVKDHVPCCEEAVSRGLRPLPVLAAADVGAGGNIIVGGLCVDTYNC